MIDLPLLVFLSMAAFVALAYVVLGLTGFGSALVAVPLLILLMPLGEVVPLVLLLDIVAFTVFGALNYTHIDWSIWRRMLPSMSLGVICAALSLHLGWLPETWLLLLLGIYIAVFGGLKLRTEYMVAQSPVLKSTLQTLAPFGFAAGVIETWFGTCGPIVVAGVLTKTSDMARFQATTSALFLPASLMALLTYAVSYTVADRASVAQLPVELTRAALLAPIVVLAVGIGNRLANRTPQQTMRKAVFALLIVSGCTLIYQAVNRL